MTISKLEALIDGLISMSDKCAQLDETPTEHDKGYREGYKAALKGVMRNLHTDNDEEIETGRNEVRGWLKANRFERLDHVGDDEVWSYVKSCTLCFLRQDGNVKVSTPSGVNVICGYEDVWVSEEGSLYLGDHACVYAQRGARR